MGLPKQLLDYIQENVPKGGAEAVRKALIEAGWDAAQVDEGLSAFSQDEGIVFGKEDQSTPAPEEKKEPKKKEEASKDSPPDTQAQEQKKGKKKRPLWHKLVFWGVILFTLLSFAYVYFFVISPTFVKEQVVNTPNLGNIDPFDESQSLDSVPVTTEQVEYLAVALDAYKLHATPGSGNPPEMEYVMTDSSDVFTITVEDNVARAKKGKAINPDLRIRGSKRTFFQLIKESDPAAAVQWYVEDGYLKVEQIADEKTLLLKGYMAVQESLELKQ